MKYTKFAELKADCSTRGWKATCYPFKIGCRGFVASSFQKLLRDFGCRRSEVVRLCKRAAEAAETGSASVAWIWSKYVQKKQIRLWKQCYCSRYQQEVALCGDAGPPPGGSTRWHLAEDLVGASRWHPTSSSHLCFELVQSRQII